MIVFNDFSTSRALECPNKEIQTDHTRLGRIRVCNTPQFAAKLQNFSDTPISHTPKAYVLY